MTSLSIKASRTRAGMLVVALALVGGTGCITTAIVQNVQQKNAVRRAEEARQRSIADLAPGAERGDAVAQRELGEALLSAPDTRLNDLPRAISWLSRAAEQGDGRAQALLGDMLASGSTRFQVYTMLPAGLRDRKRGIALLQRAATQACRSKDPGTRMGYYGSIELADQVSTYLEADRRIEESRLWRARSVMHCGVPNAVNLSSRAENERTAPQRQITWLALLMLTDSGTLIDATRARMKPETIAAAEREAAELRGAVAQSEQQYPAPRRKEMQ
jgi:TPR repeat protein